MRTEYITATFFAVVGIITGRCSQVVEKRAQELQIDILYQGAKDKMIPFREILEEQALQPSEIAYVGDDLVDLPILRQVGFAATVSDAVDDVKPFVHYVCRNRGGRGAVREICDLLLKKTGRWEAVTGRYFT